MKSRLLAASAFALAATSAAAQVGLARTAYTPQDPVLKRIWAIGQDSSWVQKLSQTLFDSLGPRLMGGPDISHAQDWLVQMYKSWGIDAKKEQYGTWRGWRRGYSHVDLIAPRQRTLDATMVGYSPGTKKQDVTADVVILPRFSSAAEFKAWLPQAKGKLVLADQPPLTCRPNADWQENATPASLANLQAARAAVAAEWTGRGGAGGGGGRGGGGGGRGNDSAFTAGIRAARTHADSVAAMSTYLGVPAAGAGRGAGGRGAGGGGGRGGANLDSIARVAVQKGDNAAIDAVLAQLEAQGGGVRGTGLSLALGGGTLGIALERGGAAGVLTTRPKDAWATREIFETYNTIAPTLSLSCEDYGLVYRLAENKQGPKIKMNLDGELLGEQPVFNVVARMQGTQLPNEYVMMSAHFDSWDGSSGATDNGTGTMTMMEAMRILKKVYPNPKRTILVGHWSGEEEGEVGSKAFTEDHPEVIKGLQGLFNQDNGTGRVERLNPGGLGDAGNHLYRWVSQLPLELRAQVNFNGGKGSPAGGGSDDYSFSCYVAPTFGMGARSWDYNAITWHTGHDTYDKVVFDDLKGNATMAAMLVYLASEDPTFISRDTSIVAQMHDPDPAVEAMRAQLAPVATPAGGGGRGGRGGGGGGGRGAGGRGNAAAPNAATYQEAVRLYAEAMKISSDSAQKLVAAGAGRGGGGGGRGAGGFPTCQKAPRVTSPRIR